MGLGLGISVDWASLVPYYAQVASAFKARVEADGGTVESMSCLKKDLKVLNPVKPPAFTGLLNDYSGAAAAYSLRLLDNTYSGDAIVVRRASDNTTQAIGFVNNELDTATLESFCSGTDGFITTWHDQSGSGNDATQGTASDQPQIVSSGSTILENGKPTISPPTSTYLLLPLSFASPASYDIFSVLKSTFDFNCLIGTNDGSDYSWLSQTASVSTTINSRASMDAAYINGLSFSGTRGDIKTAMSTQSLIYLDYSLFNYQGTGARLGYQDAGIFRMYQMQELIFYTTDQSSNRSGIETNINDFYTIY